MDPFLLKASLLWTTAALYVEKISIKNKKYAPGNLA